ncbi:33124_t:CDS:2, partial [Racocetra persica]
LKEAGWSIKKKARMTAPQYGHDIQSDRDFQDLFDTATAHNIRREKTHLIISARYNLQSISKLVQFKHITKSECIMDLSGRTLVHLDQLDDYNTVILATNAVNNYYFHMLEHTSHRSDEFWTNFIEYFGAYNRNNLLPFTSSNTASTHNIDYHECINKLLQGFKELSDSVNRFFRDYYRDLYAKLSRLSWGPFVPKPFGVFSIIAINFNTTSDYYWDEHNEANRQVIAFVSHLLLHGNFSVTKGIQHSIVYFVHDIFFYHLRKFTKVYKKARIEKGSGPIVSEQDLNNAQGLNYCEQLSKPKAKQIQIPSTVSDRRRGYI